MRKFLNPVFLFLFVLSISLPFQKVSADMGPKPGMDFTFQQAIPGSTLTIVSGTLYECEQPDCQDAKPLETLGPQHFSCDPTSCSALAYGFSTYHQLKIQFSDGKTRQSNVFKTAHFNSSYKVTIRQDDLLVEPILNLDIFNPLTYILCCCGCLVIIILIIVGLALLARQRAKKK